MPDETNKGMHGQVIRYAMSSFARHMLSLLTSFVRAKLLAPELYGIWVLVKTFPAYGSHLHLGTQAAMYYRLPKHIADGEQQEVEAIEATSLWGTIAFNLVFCVAIVVSVLTFDFGSELEIGLLLACPVILLTAYYEHINNRFKAMRLFDRLAVSHYLFALFCLPATALLAWLYGLAGVLVALILTFVATLAYLLRGHRAWWPRSGFDRGVFVQSEGAVGIFNEEVKHMPFFMLRKRDGTGLYATKDLALARLKFEEHEIDRSIYVVDTRQSDHFRHVFLTLAKMGFPQAGQCEHVPYEMVELPSGPMATRKGNVILFRTLRERMTSHLSVSYLAKYRGQWPDEEIERTAHQVALGAIKFGMLARDVNQKIVFDMEAWLALEGDTGPYLQYGAARYASILRKAEAADKVLDPALPHDAARLHAAGAALTQLEERQLVLELAQLGPQVHRAAQDLRPSVLCTYLLGLAKAMKARGKGDSGA